MIKVWTRRWRMTGGEEERFVVKFTAYSGPASSIKDEFLLVGHFVSNDNPSVEIQFVDSDGAFYSIFFILHKDWETTFGESTARVLWSAMQGRGFEVWGETV